MPRLGRKTFTVREGKVVELDREHASLEAGLQVRVVDDAHVSHALPRKSDAPGMNWDKFDEKERPLFTCNEDVREFQRRNPAFARE